MKKLLKVTGEKENIVMYTCVNEDAVPFYEKIGTTRPNDVMVYNHVEWTDFTVK